ncbi:MAG: TonB-dependent receptor [Gemmatimonadota bacterium]|nr:TonB-dependent receptor [Gemmatimonadota bacterium]
MSRAARSGTAWLILLAAVVPLGLAAQDPLQIVLLRGRIGVEPEPGSLLATPSRLTIERLPLADALARLSERSRVQIAFSSTLLPTGHHVDCDCAGLNVAGALDRLLRDTDLGYVELGSQVVVVPRGEPEPAVATLSGVVREEVSLEPIAFAEVVVAPAGGVAGSVAGFSDRYGAFVIPDPPAGPVRIETTAFGYADWARDYAELPGTPVEILLVPAPIELDSLGVLVGGRAGDPISISRDAFVVDPAMIRTMPTVMETDVLRVIAISPSASAPSDFVSVPYIRGGTSEGTPVLFDGVRLFNPFHLGGFFSAVNPEAVDHATLLSSSGAGAQHIGSLSGAIEIASRDGARDRHRVAGAVGLASSRLSVEGPVGGSTSYLVDGRRTYIDLLTRGLELAGVIPEHFPYSFSDLHAKVTHDFGDFRRLSVTGYLNSEGVSYVDSAATDRIRFDWGNTAVAAHYRDHVGGRTFLDLTLGHSRFANDLLALSGLDRPVVDTSAFGGGHMSETRADIRATWHLSRGTLTAGGQAIHVAGVHDYSHSELEDVLLPLKLAARQWRLGAFASLGATIRDPWRTRVGVRLDRFAGVAHAFSPFAELSYEGRWWAARISGARSHQSLVSLRNEESIAASLLAYDLMVPVQNGPVPRNTEVSVGWEGWRGSWRLRMDAYARRMDNLRLPGLAEDPLNEPVLGDPSLRLTGSGTVSGVEASWSWAGGPLSTVGSYRWSRATRTLDTVTYVPRFHREHELELGAALESGRSTWTARLSLRSGQPTTPILAAVPVGIHDSRGSGDTQWVVLYGEYNAGRLPHYLRLDLGWRRRSPVPRAGERFVTPFVSVTNLFSAPNVLAAETRIDLADDGPGVSIERTYLPQMPMLAFFGLEFRF